MKGKPLWRRTFPVLLFVIAFLPRAIEPVSRPMVWYLRSAHFIDAVLAGDWANTVYSEHPGVALMWPSGIGLKLYWILTGATPAAASVPPDFEPIHFFGPVPIAEIAAALLPLALLISLSIVGVYFLLRRLFEPSVAAVAALLIALSPYHLAQSKILHLDSCLATVMLLSALVLLLYCRERRRRWLILSAVLGGVALLIKTAALFLIPFCGLALLVHAIRPTQATIRARIAGLAGPLLVWVVIAAITFAALWPAMWVEPVTALKAVRQGLVTHTTTAHDAPTYFLGQATLEDPGPVFYAAALALRSSEVTLCFLVVATVMGISHLVRHRRLSAAGLDYVLLLAYAIFFLAQMSLASKKIPRYILPALLALIVLAAAGIVAWARRLACGRPAGTCVLIALPLLLQSALILPRHPYYGTTFSWIAGGPAAAAHTILIGEEGEGLAQLTAALNAEPDADQLVVAAQLKHVFNQTFAGTTLDIDQGPADYVVFHRNYTVRDYKVDEWGALWEQYAPRTPDQEVIFDGVPYAWLYRTLPAKAQPEHSTPVDLGDRYRFLGYDLRSTEVAPGDRIPLVLYWQATEPVTDDLSIFVHLLGPDGTLIWQDDGAADHGARPTWSWGSGETISDPHTLALPQDLPEGDYALVTGLYDWRSGERLAAATPAEDSLADDQIAVATFAVRRPTVAPTVWIARTLAGLLLLSAVIALWRPHE